MVKANFINEEQYSMIIRYAAIGQALIENDVEAWSFYWDSLDKFIVKQYNDDMKSWQDLDEYVEWQKDLFMSEEKVEPYEDGEQLELKLEIN